MAIILRLDRVMADRKMSLNDLSEKVGVSNVNLSNANLRGAILTWDTAQNVNLDNATYDQFTVFNHGFNPDAHNMFFEKSSLAYYGIK